tara:strand:+ start:2303 stop:3253 length:951 start_codon:yes stop_codon:yes gene_type:complete
MQAAMENYNQTKRTADEAGMNASKASPKQVQRFYLPPQLSKDNGEIQCHVNWTGKKLPIWVSKGYKVPSDGKVRTKSIGTPMLPTKFVDLGPNGDIGKFNKDETNACYNMGVVRVLPEKITRKMPQAQDTVDEFYTNLRTLVDGMITTGWNTEGVWTKWKKQADKEVKKALKKDPESKITAEEIFRQNAKTSVLGKWEDQETGDEFPMYCFSTKYQMKIQGEMKNNRPTFWKQIRNEYGDRSVKDISDDLPSKKSGLRHGSVVKFGFELNAFDLDTMYGIKAKLGRNILCVHLEKSTQRSVGEMLGQDTYFSDDED